MEITKTVIVLRLKKAVPTMILQIFKIA